MYNYTDAHDGVSGCLSARQKQKMSASDVTQFFSLGTVLCKKNTFPLKKWLLMNKKHFIPKWSYFCENVTFIPKCRYG